MSAIGVSPCPPFVKPTGVPGVIYDGNTVAWFKHNDMANVVMDGANRVSQWSDKTGLGHHLLQAAGGAQPLWSNVGILFDGGSDYMKCNAFVLIQPEFIYFVGRQISWTNNEYIFDGNTLSRAALTQATANPQINIYAGVFGVANNNNMAMNTFKIIRTLIQGATSFLQVNKTAAINGNAGANVMGGFTLGAAGNNVGFSNIEVKEIIIRRTADNAATQESIYNYLYNSNGIL